MIRDPMEEPPLVAGSRYSSLAARPQGSASPHFLQEFFDPRLAKGLPTGIHIDDCEVHYHAGIWHLPYRSRADELL